MEKWGIPQNGLAYPCPICESLLYRDERAGLDFRYACGDCCLFGWEFERMRDTLTDVLFYGRTRVSAAQWHKRIGFVLRVGKETDDAPHLNEAKRLFHDWDRVKPFVECMKLPFDRTAWLVYADYLDEQDYPLNAAALRATHDPK